MFYHVSKALKPFLSPYIQAILLLLLALWWMRKEKNRRSKIAVALAVLLLVVPGMPFVSNSLIHSMEVLYPAHRTEDYPSADAIVVLGGSTTKAVLPRHEPEENWGSRLLQAARLYQANKAETIVVSGGLPYSVKGGALRTLAQDMAEILEVMGVPASSIVAEDESHNTTENAAFSAKILRERGVSKILLVTNALHLRRAVALFEAEGFEVVPVPNSFLVTRPALRLRTLKPNANSVGLTEFAIHELVGDMVNRLLGRL